MGIQVNVHDAKTQLSKLLERVEHGEEITIARNGRPVARLIAVGHQNRSAVAGSLRGKIRVSDDFDAPDEQIERDFGAH